MNLSDPSLWKATKGSANFLSRHCATEASWCGGDSHCCPGLRCNAVLGGSGRRCMQQHPVQRCSARWKQCSVFGWLAPKCCDGLQCVRKGFLDWKCERQCMAVGHNCGGPGQQTVSCCGAAHCIRNPFS